MKKQCIVTGGAGFIGSHLCELLLNRGFVVIAVDNLSTGRIENIDSIKNNPNFSFVKLDVVKPYSLEFTNILKESTYIFHLASPASPNPKSDISYLNLPLETLKVNSIGTQMLLDQAKKNNSQFLYASTSEVYGDPLIHPQPESYWGNVNPFGSRSCYDEAKRFGEAVCYTYINKYNVNARVVRIFNTYGPRMHKDDGRAVVEFITSALKDKPIPIFGTGKQTRSFCFVSDLVEGIYRAMFLDDTCSEVYNLGNPGEISMLDLAKTIIKLTNSKSSFSHETLPGDDPKRRQPEITKAKIQLKWEPKVSLTYGLIKTIDYFRNYPL